MHWLLEHLLRNDTYHFSSTPISLAKTSDIAKPEVDMKEIYKFLQEIDSSLWRRRK